jgi:glycosyltransferase involved in cell wall biosynthesis
LQVHDNRPGVERDEPGFEPADISVLVITYNHERYIGGALESVLAQKTSRRVELIVSEDRSTDRTFDLIRQYADAHAGIRVLRSEKNLASNAVVARAIEAASGKYVCLLDGDDYWIDDGKLEKQADILDGGPNLSAVFHNAVVVDGEGDQTAVRWTPSTQAPACDLAAMWQGNPFATCAGMLRREALADLGPWYDGFFPITDWPLYILCAAHGAIAFHVEPVGAYRLHASGLFSALADMRKLDQIEGFYERMSDVLPAQARAARAGRTRYFFDWALAYEEQGNSRLARSCLRRALRAGGVGSAVSLRQFGRVALRLLSRPAFAERAA